jgi:hypothetical protein
MAYELKEGQTNIFRNDKKTEEKHPEYTGKIKLNGILYEIALWVKDGENGKFFSGRVSEKRQRNEVLNDAAKKVDASEMKNTKDLPF